jgi:hypothetical protein
VIGIPRALSAALPTPTATPTATTPNTIPTSALATIFAAMTRPRRGVIRKVGRIVPWRISPVIDIAPTSPAKRAPSSDPNRNTSTWLEALSRRSAGRLRPCSRTARSTRPSMARKSPRFVNVERCLSSSARS